MHMHNLHLHYLLKASDIFGIACRKSSKFNSANSDSLKALDQTIIQMIFPFFLYKTVLIFTFFLHKTLFVCTHQICCTKIISMRTHSICFCSETGKTSILFSEKMPPILELLTLLITAPDKRGIQINVLLILHKNTYCGTH